MQGIIVIVGLIVLGILVSVVWSPYGLIFIGLLAGITGVAFYAIGARDEGLPPESRDDERQASQGVGGELRN